MTLAERLVNMIYWCRGVFLKLASSSFHARFFVPAWEKNMNCGFPLIFSKLIDERNAFALHLGRSSYELINSNKYGSDHSLIIPLKHNFFSL